MQKRFVWIKGWRTNNEGIDFAYIHRCRSLKDFEEQNKDHKLGLWWCKSIPATDPEVRRIQRRLAAGEQITFPVEITP